MNDPHQGRTKNGLIEQVGQLERDYAHLLNRARQLVERVDGEDLSALVPPDLRAEVKRRHPKEPMV